MTLGRAWCPGVNLALTHPHPPHTPARTSVRRGSHRRGLVPSRAVARVCHGGLCCPCGQALLGPGCVLAVPRPVVLRGWESSRCRLPHRVTGPSEAPLGQASGGMGETGAPYTAARAGAAPSGEWAVQRSLPGRGRVEELGAPCGLGSAVGGARGSLVPRAAPGPRAPPIR